MHCGSATNEPEDESEECLISSSGASHLVCDFKLLWPPPTSEILNHGSAQKLLADHKVSAALLKLLRFKFDNADYQAKTKTTTSCTHCCVADPITFQIVSEHE